MLREGAVNQRDWWHWVKWVVSGPKWSSLLLNECALLTKNLKICLKQHFEISSAWSKWPITFARTAPGFCACTYVRFSSAEPNLCLRQSPSLIPNLKSWTKPPNSRLNPQTWGQSVAVVCIGTTCNLRSWSNTQTTPQAVGRCIRCGCVVLPRQPTVCSPTLLWAISCKDTQPLPPPMNCPPKKFASEYTALYSGLHKLLMTSVCYTVHVYLYQP